MLQAAGASAFAAYATMGAACTARAADDHPAPDRVVLAPPPGGMVDVTLSVHTGLDDTPSIHTDAMLVGKAVEGRWPAAPAASTQPVGLLVRRDGNHRTEAARAWVLADRA